MRDLSLASAVAAGDGGGDAVAGDEAGAEGDEGDEDAGVDDEDGVAAGCEPPQAAMARTPTTRSTAKRIRPR
jgi:hypothetical protein